MADRRGLWHGDQYYFGMHYDLHAGPNDTELGTQATPEQLVPMLKLMDPDFVQTDCKGHPGLTSWYSKTPEASVSPGVKQDALAGWRAATKALGLPLHCHYSGIWDRAAGAKHPEWSVVLPDGSAQGAPFGQNSGAPTHEIMCPRSPYLDELMIPQMLELIDDWDVDGFWVDGDLWAVKPCYCARCRTAFAEATGIDEPPTETDDPNWISWIQFTRESFEEYVTRYCDAVHAHKPGVLVCSNWLQTFMHPGEPKVPTDWISGDNAWVYGLDRSRCEARFLSTRNKHWDMMIWAFYSSHGLGNPKSPFTFKPVEMIEQEAAMFLAFGGGVQVYENPGGLRTGQLIPWRQERLGQVGQFVKERQELCQHSETIPQVAVLHSEHHIRSTLRGRNLMWNVDTSGVEGAVYSLLENHVGVDILDEWALKPVIDQFPVVVAAEQDLMSEEMVDVLKEYTAKGGHLLVSGVTAHERFGGEFLGVTMDSIEEKRSFCIPAEEGAVPVYSDRFGFVTPTTAKAVGQLGTTPLVDDRLLAHPAVTYNQVGQGKVAYVPYDIFRYFKENRYPMVRSFVGNVLQHLAGDLAVTAEAPVCIDLSLRKAAGKTVIHLNNRLSGIPNQPNNGAIDEIPPVGPITLCVRVQEKPSQVYVAFEQGSLEWTYDGAGQTVTITVGSVHIHSAVVLEGAAGDVLTR